MKPLVPVSPLARLVLGVAFFVVFVCTFSKWRLSRRRENCPAAESAAVPAHSPETRN